MWKEFIYITSIPKRKSETLKNSNISAVLHLYCHLPVEEIKKTSLQNESFRGWLVPLPIAELGQKEKGNYNQSNRCIDNT